MAAVKKVRFVSAVRWALAFIGGLAAYVSSVLVVQNVVPQIIGRAVPPWAFIVIALPPLVLGYWLSPLNRGRKKKEHRVEIRLDPDLYHKMRVRMRSKGYSYMSRYIVSLIRSDTKGTQ